MTAGRLSAESPRQPSKKIRIAVRGRTANREDIHDMWGASSRRGPGHVVLGLLGHGLLPQPPRRVYSTVSQEAGCNISVAYQSATASQSFGIGQLLVATL